MILPRIMIALFLFLLVAGCSKSGPVQSVSASEKGDKVSLAGEPDNGGGRAEETHEALMSDGVRKAKLVLETKDGRDVIGILVTGKESLPQGMRYEYEWTVNGKPAGKEQTISGFKRGDKLAAMITPFDGEKKGRSRVLETEIKNTTPRIAEVKSLAVEDERLSYQVVAVDADGDGLTFSLVDAPKGVKIDGQGKIEWRPGAGEKESVTVTVKVADGHGGEASYPFKMTTEKSGK